MAVAPLVVIIPIVLFLGILAYIFLRRRSYSRTLLENRKKSIEMLRQLTWLSSLSEKDFKRVARGFRIRIFRLGEMAFLTGHPRTATVVAESPVQVLWISRAALKRVMKGSPQLKNGLWEFASMRFAMNLLGKKEPYSLWEQNKFIQWLSAGEIKLPNKNGWIDLEGKIGVLVIGTAAQHDGSKVLIAPCTLTGTDYEFSKEARVFLRDE